jgi:AbrB family looped-hinge helix DNA binding protein
MAEKLATTKMSSKGQIVIPDKIRSSLNIHQGTEFIVVSSGDAIILKPIVPPALSQFAELLDTAKKEARRAKLTKADLKKAISEVRKKKK